MYRNLEIKEEFNNQLNAFIKHYETRIDRFNDTILDLTETNTQLNDPIKDLAETKNKLIKIENVLFSKNWIYSKTFIDDNEKQKSFIIPMNKNGIYDKMEFNDAVNYCAKFNSTLVEIESQRKQSIFQAFMIEIIEPFDSYKLAYFWINGRRDSSGMWKWINSGNEFNYTNWNSSQPKNNIGFDYVYVNVEDDADDKEFGKWRTTTSTLNLVICELEFNI